MTGLPVLLTWFLSWFIPHFFPTLLRVFITHTNNSGLCHQQWMRILLVALAAILFVSPFNGWMGVKHRVSVYPSLCRNVQWMYKLLSEPVNFCRTPATSCWFCGPASEHHGLVTPWPIICSRTTVWPCVFWRNSAKRSRWVWRDCSAGWLKAQTQTRICYSWREIAFSVLG